MHHPFLNSCLLTAMLWAGIASSSADPLISNVRVSQRPGTNFVDVYYNLSGSGPNGATVSVELSDNRGTSYDLPITWLSGHVGNGVPDGTNRYLVWNAGSDRPSSFSTAMRLRLTAVDSPPIPEAFALIPAGPFSMGRTSGDTDSDAPSVTVTVSAFYMGKYEVTKALWDDVRLWGIMNGYTDLRTGTAKSANHPVTKITWFDALKWCNARSQKEGLKPPYLSNNSVLKTGFANTSTDRTANGYRLPTEAEWEKAARGGVSGKRYPWGTDTITHSQANHYATGTSFGNLSGDLGYHPTYALGDRPQTSPVGSFAPNGYGLYDMAGNVTEWCRDWYGDIYGQIRTDPRGASTGTLRVTRGGSWISTAYSCRAAQRGADYPTDAYDGSGFRLARNSTP